MTSSPAFKDKFLTDQASPVLRKLHSTEWSEAEGDAIANADKIEALRDINNIDELVWCVLKEEGFFDEYQDTFGIMDKINKILGWNDPRKHK